jgi:ketosteroid isomerase-like protein
MPSENDAQANRRVVEAYWATMNTNDWQAAGRLLHDDFTLDWPQSGERIRGRENFAQVNAEYPAAGPWRFEVQRLVADAEGVASDVVVSAPEITSRVVSFFRMRDGRIWHITEYWPDPYEAAAWRAQWVERYQPDT